MPMTLERAGGVFLLQVLQPTKLIGSAVAVTGPGVPGKVKIVFFAEKDHMDVVVGEHVTVVLSRAVAMTLAGTIAILVVQNRMMRGEDVGGRLAFGDPTAKVSARWSGQNASMMAVSLLTGGDAFAIANVDEQVEVVMTERCAEEFAMSIVREFARVAASA
jgi:hypothetical protein